tara:strand:+ start:213 stop:476 length:264 start_codon:yes stop_codon:yes gene_type:complete
MTRTLAFRRHQSQLKKSKVSHWVSTKLGYQDLIHSSVDFDQILATPRSIGIVATTPASYRHVDRWQEKSRQEKRDDASADAMLDYGV